MFKILCIILRKILHILINYFKIILIIILKLYIYILGVQLCFRRFSIDGFSGKWWSK